VRIGWRGALLAASLLGACAYYNGLYNANRLAADARRAEREGRPGEARSLWAQAAVKAESVATRYPKSKYRDDALVLWGQGLARAGGCNRAVDPLAVAIDSSSDPKLLRDARLTLAECQLSMRRPDEAIATLGPLLEERDSAVVREARHLRGLAYLKRRDPAAAVEDLASLPPEVAGLDLASAYLALGDPAEAGRTLTARSGERYDEARWLPLLDTLGAASPQAAEQLVDRLSARSDLTTGQHARLLLADGRRWAAVGRPDRADERYREARSAAPDSIAGRSAAAYLVLSDLENVTELGQLEPVQEALGQTQQTGGPGAQIVEPAANLVGALQSVLQSVPQREEPADRDVRLFLLAEMFRDSLNLPNLATGIFLRMAQDYPESVFAPKALLAAVVLDPARSDSVAQVLRARYPVSPYTLALSGSGGAQFTQLEDSLRTRLAQERQLIRGGRFVEDAAEREGRIRR
jgi:hypothetical protein